MYQLDFQEMVNTSFAAINIMIQMSIALKLILQSSSAKTNVEPNRYLMVKQESIMFTQLQRKELYISSNLMGAS